LNSLICGRENNGNLFHACGSSSSSLLIHKEK